MSINVLPGQYGNCLGYFQAVGVTAAVTIPQLLSAATSGGTVNIPTGATLMLAETEGASVRWTDDGIVTPTANVGMNMPTLTPTGFTGSQIRNMKVIQATATATLSVSFYS